MSILIGVTLKLLGAGQMAAGLEEVDIASRRAALSLAIAKKEVTGLDAAFARNALTNESLALRQTRVMDRMATQAMRTRAMVSGAFAVAGSAAIVASINQAAKFEQAMVSVRIATGASADEFDRFKRLVVSTSNVTAQSAVTIAGELAMAASSGLNNPARLRAAFPQLARAADVMWLSPKHLDPTESIAQLSKLSHLFGAYGGAPLHKMIDAAVRLMFVQPESLTKLVNQGKYFVPTALAAGVSMKDIFTETMSMGQLGLMTGRGGTSLRSYIQYLLGSPMITEYRSKKQLQGFEALGLYDSAGRNRFVRSDGTLALEASLAYLAQKRRTMKPSDFLTDTFKAFGQLGEQYLIPRTASYAMAQQAMNTTAFNRIAPAGQAVEIMWAKYMNTTIGKWRYFVTNFENLSMSIFLPTLPAITAALNTLGGVLGKMSGFFMDNPAAAWTAALGAVGGTASLAIIATANLWALNRALLATGSSASIAAGGTRIGAGSVLAGWARGVLPVSIVGLSAAAVSALVWGMFRESHYVAMSPRHQGPLEQWAMYGANRGLMPPGARGSDAYTDAWGVRRLGALSGVPAYYAGGNAFEADRMKRALQQHVSAPIIQRLTGTGATSVTDSVQTSSRETVDAIRSLGDRFEQVMSHLGITINVPAATGHAQTLHKLLGGQNKPATAGGFPTHPHHSSRTGGNFKA